METDSSCKSNNEELAINADGIHVTYPDGTEAVRDVTLSVEKGEFFGFLGPNGAGKTTTIKTFVTLLHPNRGSVTINGYDVKTEPQAVSESIGYMAQETSVDEELTARENLRFACNVYGVPPSERGERIEELLDLVGLTDVADKRAENYSGGMKKRLDAATVLVHRPPLVFLDEPTTGLDPEARMHLWNHFKQLNEHGTTVFLTTQYLEEVDRLCDRLSVIQDGEIIATDTPEALKSAVGGDILDLTLEDSSRQARERAIEVVRESDALETPSIETTSDGFTITAENAREAASELFVSLHEANVIVTGFDVRSPTLDDVFLKLTSKNPEASNGDETNEQGALASGQGVAE
ncbi:ABC transporter ATP-binding protein [Natronobacterium gregoryi]|uniref:Daunorubicin resistance ABC transporter ATP-binding subunit n=1 Tax=Natronobacterium gregoryi (strain ATCC 43098 / DSM 3393 / CCM 3738 / CIP 104747 / IAM 13177 / JCM 8860 / NBRC 102187 / NCIMB 2189 / SP2) TaxID=797304 RepID=L9XSS9_NATGS|nr:ATP-binding cassette domain-containing protein [Natronobacterium gregoryi]ELY63688.1 daunorubicin resistance ABC transporter ATP-binding subunit [Natronobacterium gregoryi SP2]